MATFRDALEAQATEAEKGAVTATEETPEATEEGADEDPSVTELRTLFAEESDEDDPDDEDELVVAKPEGEESDEEADAYSKRVRKRIGRANERRREAEDLAARLQGQIDGIADRYKGRKDPLAQAREDANFMDAIEQLWRTPEGREQVDAFVAAIKQFQQDGRVPKVTEQETKMPFKGASDKTERDPEVSAIIQENVGSKVEKALPGVNRLAIEAVTEYVLSKDNPTRLSEKDIRHSASKLFRERGYSEADIFTTKREGESKRPPTRSARAPSTKATNGQKGKEESSEYKSLAEAQEKRAAVRRSFIDSLSG